MPPVSLPTEWINNFVMPAIITTSTLSLFGCAFIFSHAFKSYCQREPIDFTMRMIIVMSIIDLFDAGFKLFGTYSYSYRGLCNVQGFVMNAAGIAAVSWLACMSHSWYSWVVKRDCEATLRRWFVVYLIVSFLPPLVVSLYLGMTGKYGPASFYCWISDEYKGMRITFFFSWIIASALFILLMCLLVIFDAKRRAQQQENVEAQTSLASIYNKLAAYVSVYIFVWGPSLINRFVEWQRSEDDPPILWLLGLHIICNNSQGFLNAMIYGGAFRILLRALRFHENSEMESLRTSLCSNIPTTEVLTQTISLFCTTFNMGEGPMPEDLSQWISIGHDIYVIGVQECLNIASVRAKVKEYLENSSQQPYEDYVREIGCSNTTLGYHGYIGILIFVPLESVQSGRFYMPKPSKSEVNCGKLLNVRTSNKGAVGFAFRYLDTSISVVSCHLSSDCKGKSQILRRNEDAALVWQSLNLSGDSYFMDFPLLHHHTIVLGDLNYRLSNKNATSATILNLIENTMRKHKWISTPSPQLHTLVIDNENSEWTTENVKIFELDEDWSHLLEHDELHAVMGLNQVFSGFEENTITFPPTFRRTRGFSLSKNNINDCYCTVMPHGGGTRVPSYTDRILYHSLDNVKSDLNCCRYQSHEDIDTSDHKPVSCVFRIMTKESPYAPSYQNLKKVSFMTQTSTMMDYDGVKDCTILLKELLVQWQSSMFPPLSDNGIFTAKVPLIGLEDKFCITTVFPLPLEDIFSDQRKLHELAARWDHGILPLHANDLSQRHLNHFQTSWKEALLNGIHHRCYAQAKRNMHIALSVHTDSESFGQCTLNLENAYTLPNEFHTFQYNLTSKGAITGTLKGIVQVKIK
ncbi:hypothetical protein THRCLA_11429 [Thraustotheca clavata]|uniref:Inositol polyphosphate-related phosphatase domain-containing protein n=1 Tax=Thraustotheca clavata TaxID=74557 RepID=A0A1V9Y7Q5_9STRA|nr:hypothetical protein THRCLA_11429 [Thraustotheca clavata]